VKETLKGNGVRTPASLVGKSKYWYENEIKLSSADINEIEELKKWYKYQLDTYLPSDGFVLFRKGAGQVEELEWRKVLRAIGLKADAIQALEINDVCDFATLNHTSKKWKISEPSSKTLRSDENLSDWKDWQKMGLTGTSFTLLVRRTSTRGTGWQISTVHNTRDLCSGILTPAK